MKKLLTTLISSLIAFAGAHAVSVTNFSSASVAVTLQNPAAFATPVADGTDLNGSDFGSVAVFDLIGPAINVGGLTTGGTMTISGIDFFSAPASLFTINLRDASNNVAEFTGGAWSDFGAAPASTVLTLNSVDSGFDVSSISGFDLNTAGVGAFIFGTLTSMDVSFTPVPEPSAFALLAGAFGIAAVMVRRRR